MKTHDQFLQILFPDAVAEGDLDILAESGPEGPGRVRLGRAIIGRSEAATPNSRPLLSGAGGKIGFVASVDFFDPDGPFHGVYWLEGGVE